MHSLLISIVVYLIKGIQFAKNVTQKCLDFLSTLMVFILENEKSTWNKSLELLFGVPKENVAAWALRIVSNLIVICRFIILGIILGNIAIAKIIVGAVWLFLWIISFGLSREQN